MLTKVIMPNEQFYARLSIHQIPIGEMLMNGELFSNVPEDWHIIITDIRGSTKAVMNGQHQLVNLVATGSTVAVLNIAYNHSVYIPFFFGGDGATFIVPPTLLDKLVQTLQIYRDEAVKNIPLDLRIGTVPVQEIYKNNHCLSISKFGSSPSLVIPVVLGSGLDYAEKLIKGANYLLERNMAEQVEPNLTGMLCRWDEIPAPDEQKEIITLLVISRDYDSQALAFSRVMQAIDDTYGPSAKRQPISIGKLRLKSTFTKLGNEVKTIFGQLKWKERLRNWIVNALGYIYFRTPAGSAYLKNLVEMSDTLVIDGRINTIISGTQAQRLIMTLSLDELEATGKIWYGLHVSDASIMSCYVRNPQEGHLYFVDGGSGGYTMAAKMLKSKIK